MVDIRIERMAEVMVDYSLKIQPKDRLAVSGDFLGHPLMKEIARLGIKRGAYVDVYTNLPDLKPMIINESTSDQLHRISTKEKTILEQYNKVAFVMADFNTKELSSIPAEKLKEMMIGKKEVREAFYKRMGESKNDSWCLTQFPTASSAQEAGMSLEEYENFIYSACLCDKPDASKRWLEISKKQDILIKKLNEVKEIHIKSKDTDIKASVAGRTWENCDGKLNFPDGEVFTGPVETSIEGHIRFSFPGIYMGKEVEDIRLEFKKGKVVKATAMKGKELLNQLLQADEGASYIGELAIGTNYGITKFTKNILFDEKLGGTIHMAIGSAYPETGSKNKSTIHWDMICDMKAEGEIFADGKLIYKNGKFVKEWEI